MRVGSPKETVRVPALAALITILVLTLALPSTVALTASSDKNVYGLGECVTITGSTQDPNVLVTFVVYDPNQGLVTLDQTRSDNNAQFTVQVFCFPDQPSDRFPPGEYTIVVRDTGAQVEQTLTVTLSFEAPAETQTQTQTETTASPATVTVTATVNQTVTETQTVTDTVTTTSTVTQTQTVTQTNTVTQTVTQIQTTTQTVTQTQTQTVTQTQTTTQTTTQTQTVTQTNTVTQTVQSMGAAVGAAGIALVAGFAVAFLLARSKGS